VAPPVPKAPVLPEPAFAPDPDVPGLYDEPPSSEHAASANAAQPIVTHPSAAFVRMLPRFLQFG
jgi:hypothetical protein